MHEHIKEFIKTNANLFPEIKNSNQVDILQFSGANIRKEFNKVIFLIFEKNEKRPAICAMISRDNRQEEWLKNEYNNLKFIYNSTSDFIKSTIPRPIAFEKVEKHAVFFETAVSGRSLDWFFSSKKKLKRKDNIPNIFKMAKEWLIIFFNDIKQNSKCTSKQEKKLYLESIADIYRKNFELSEQETAGLNDLIDQIETISKSNIFFSPQRMHFWTGSVYIADDKINVIDWKLYGNTHLPLFDILTFITSVGLKINNSNTGNGFKQTYFAKNWFSDIARETIIDYCSHIQADKAFTGAFMAFTLIISANYAHSICRENESDYAQLWRGLLKIYFDNKNTFIIQ